MSLSRSPDLYGRAVAESLQEHRQMSRLTTDDLRPTVVQKVGDAYEFTYRYRRQHKQAERDLLVQAFTLQGVSPTTAGLIVDTDIVGAQHAN